MRVKHKSKKLLRVDSFIKAKGLHLLLLITSISFTFIGAYLYKEKIHLEVRAAAANLKDTMVNYATSITNDSKVYELGIPFKGYLELARQQKEAMTNGIGFHDDNNFVNADLLFGDVQYKAKVRVKGTLSDHWDTDKWSLNVKLRDGKVGGMKRFSMMHPKTRGYLHGFIDSKLFESEGLLNARQDFVNIVINGKNSGVYVIEEKPRKELLESQGRREGPILAFDKKDLIKEWVNYDSDPLYGKDLSRGASSFYASDIKVYYQPNGLAGENIQKKSMLLLDNFRRGDMRPSEIFDLNLLGKYLALKVIIGSSELDPNDIYFYYDPLRSVFEPIAIDLHGTTGIGDWWKKKEKFSDRRDLFTQTLLEDNEVQKYFIRYLKYYSEKGRVQKLIDSVLRDNSRAVKTLLSNYPQHGLDIGRYIENASYINSVLSPSKAIEVKKEVFRNSVIYKVGNLQEFPIVINEYVDAEKRVALKKIIPGNAYNKKIVFHDIINSFDIKPDGYLTYNILGVEDNLQRYLIDNAIDYSISGQTLKSMFGVNERHDCLSLKKDGVVVFSKICNIKETLLVDSDVAFQDCSRVELSNNASLIFVGGKVSITSEEGCKTQISGDGTGGIAFIDSPKLLITNVDFDNLSTPKVPGVLFTGAVTAVTSEVEISNTLISNSKSEDGLNLVRSRYRLNNVIVENSFSDAVDIDFGSGVLSELEIINSGNDGLDVSGALVEIKDLRVFGSGDKGFSVGEKSSVNATGVEIDTALIGVASKDSSTATIKGLVVTDSKFPLASLNKKPEYQGGSIKIYTDGEGYKALKKNYLLDSISEIRINNEELVPNSTTEQLKMDLYNK